METNNYLSFIPGFFMGITRAMVSHPFEILKIKSQLNIKKDIHVFRGLHYSVLATGIERGIQFAAYDFFKKKDNNILSSLKASCLSTFIGVPYNFYIVNNSVIKKKFSFSIVNLSKTVPLEYVRSFTGSSIFLYTYNNLKEKDIPLWLCAFSGTSFSWVVTYPIDNIRNQIVSKNNNFSIKYIYNGIQYPILRSIPSSIIGMYVYEKIKNYINN